MCKLQRQHHSELSCQLNTSNTNVFKVLLENVTYVINPFSFSANSLNKKLLFPSIFEIGSITYEHKWCLRTSDGKSKHINYIIKVTFGIPLRYITITITFMYNKMHSQHVMWELCTTERFYTILAWDNWIDSKRRKSRYCLKTGTGLLFMCVPMYRRVCVHMYLNIVTLWKPDKLFQRRQNCLVTSAENNLCCVWELMSV